MERLTLRTTRRNEFIDITSSVREAVRKSGVREGLVVVYCPHTTAAITINENADPSVVSDILTKTSKLVEHGDPDYRHMEGNSDSHIKSSIVGASETLIIEGGQVLLGTWQGVYFCEFDGPRTRKVYIKITGG